MPKRYAHDVGERVIPIGEAYDLERWFAHDEPWVTVELKPRSEVAARWVISLLIVAIWMLTALVGMAD